jgi:hypothetical protein
VLKETRTFALTDHEKQAPFKQRLRFFLFQLIQTRVAGWHIFKSKIPIWVNFGGYCNGRFWYTLWPFGLLYGHLVYFVSFCYILGSFGICSRFCICCTKKNLATLIQTKNVRTKKMAECLSSRNFKWKTTSTCSCSSTCCSCFRKNKGSI